MRNSILPNSTVPSDQIETLFENSNDNIYWKDTSCKYLGVNTAMTNDVNKSASDIINSTDFDLVWHDYAKELQQHDKEVMITGNPKTYLERGKDVNGNQVIYRSKKFPLFSKQNKIIGVFGISALHTHKITLQSLINKDKFIEHLASFKSLNPTTELKHLSNKQTECLFYFVRGMTMKEIGASMSLSPRTIEKYLETIKNYLKCKTRSEIMSKIIEIHIQTI